MSGRIRNIFPGGNTPGGFYSYYQYILGQKEASSIICLKGGPGTGKSSFMKDIGQHFIKQGDAVDYFWCSSDPDSLDGLVLRDRKVAVIDGTSPHIVDPVHPGAVDMIINLGEYWDGETIKEYKDHIMQSSRKIKRWFCCAYNNLKAAEALTTSLSCMYKEMMLPGELYSKGAEIINRELSHYPVTLSEGKRKKYFASAITPKGTINHLESLLSGYKKIYCLMTPPGLDTGSMLKTVSENSVHRGFMVEEFYCPMKPDQKLEHLLIPELELAFVTANRFHDIEPDTEKTEVVFLDIRDYVDWNRIDLFKDVLIACEKDSNRLIEQAVSFLKMAKTEHDILESFYMPNMNFQKIEEVKAEIIGKIERKVL